MDAVVILAKNNAKKTIAITPFECTTEEYDTSKANTIPHAISMKYPKNSIKNTGYIK